MNDQFYGKIRKPAKTKGNTGNVDLEFESINPYEFKKGMNYELNKLGVLSLRESSEEDREKATEAVIKNLKDVGAYYSYMEHYEVMTRNMDKKPSFKTFLKEVEGHSMKEVKEKFDNDKMKEIKLKESIRAEVRNKINEVLGNKNLNEGRKFLNLNEVEPQTELIGIVAHTLKDMSAEEAIDAIDRLMLYLKDAKADIEFNQQ